MLKKKSKGAQKLPSNLYVAMPTSNSGYPVLSLIHLQLLRASERASDAKLA